MPIIVKQHPDKPDYFMREQVTSHFEEFKKEKPDLEVIKERFSRPIAVLGAGPSLPEDLKKLPEGCLYMSCNHHAFRLIDCQFMVFLDDPKHPSQNGRDEYKEAIKRDDIFKISQLLDYTDYYTVNEFPKILNPIGETGMFGVWVACYITSGDVYVCGMDVKRDGQEHFYEAREKASWGGVHYNGKIKKWKQVFHFCEKPERIKIMSGPLKELL